MAKPKETKNEAPPAGKKNPLNVAEKTFSIGTVSATVWKNAGRSKEGEITEFRTVALQRSYRDKEGQWQDSKSLRVSDLPKAIHVLTKAYEHLALRGREPFASEDQSTEPQT